VCIARKALEAVDVLFVDEVSQALLTSTSMWP